MYVSNVIDRLTDELEEQVSTVTGLLSRSLRSVDVVRQWVPRNAIDVSDLGRRPVPVVKPELNSWLYLSGWQRLVWGFYGNAKRAAVIESNDRYRIAASEFNEKWRIAIEAGAAEKVQFDARARAAEAVVNEFNSNWERLAEHAADGDLESQWQLFEVRFAAYMNRQRPLPGSHRITYSSNSRRVVVEVDVPTKAVIPAAKSVRFLKTTGEHRYSYRTDTEVKRMYTGLVAQAVLSVVNGVFAIAPSSLVETVGVNAVVEAPDPATGVLSKVPIVSLVTSRAAFEVIQLADVDPIACLKYLSAAVSRSPAEVVPIRPLARLDMTDPRFVADSDVLSDLDIRPNLMELTPNEFEGLVQNLFAKMGLDTKQTRPSRDGGVDAIAYDPRPVLGGKIVIQAKRYKGTVGVSAVRDLFGTLQNEGGSKGILVTTSGYGSASFEFAKNKPLELIDGSNLLYLLKEHAGIDAKIVMPEDWEDPHPDFE